MNCDWLADLERHLTAAVLFDLGNTLAAYYHTSEFRPILAEAIGAVRDALTRRGLCRVSEESVLAASVTENREAPDYRVTPMTDRFERIFQVSLASDPSLAATTCGRFMAPIFALGRVYDDTLPTVAMLRDAGVRTAIVSNAPWGSPPELWRRELRRLGLSDAADAVVLCGDVGWRKPAPQIVHHALSKLGCQPEECMFVGDDLGEMSGGALPSACARCSSIEMAVMPGTGQRVALLSEIFAVLKTGA